MELDNPISELVDLTEKNLVLCNRKEEEKNMIPSFSRTHPITKYSDLSEFISKPPEWVSRVLPLQKRSGYVIKNELTDCHTSRNKHQIKSRLDCRTVPKTLVCHDYKGGYHADAFVPFEGSEDKTLATDGYTFYNWAQIDYFVYFSHYFITIPPLAWINAGHKNGVKVLGTLITEGHEGIKTCKEEIFNNCDQMREFVYQLVDIQRIYGFDGWLLNIENQIENVEFLRDFVELVTVQTHQQDSESVVIWYDSVTKDGLLKWQDQLNHENKCFFDSCDGIFLNYCWDAEKLENTAVLAGARKFDVFVGVDVFGRNMFGGGQFNTYKALELVRQCNLSVALFAPGWTHEMLEKVAEQSVISQFLLRDDGLWGSLWPFLYTHPVCDYFQTDFHIGLDSDNYNLFVQQVQTSRMLNPQNVNNIPKFPLHTINSCNCLRREYFEGKNICEISVDQLQSDTFVHSLFSCNIKISGRTGVFFLTRKLERALQTHLDITLLTCLQSGSVREVRLLGQEKLLPVDNLTVLEVNQMDYKAVVYDATLNNIVRKPVKLLSNPKYTGTVSINIFQFNTTPCTLMEVGAIVKGGTSIQLLEFGIVKLG